MSAEPAAAVAALEVVQPETAAEAEALAEDLDRQRAEVSREHEALTRRVPGQSDPDWNQRMRSVTDRGLALDRERIRARKLARDLKEREIREASWKLAFATMPEHKRLCAGIVEALDRLIPMLEAAAEMRAQHERAAGRCQLHNLRGDLDEIRRLRWSANLVVNPPKAEPRRNGERR